MCKEDTYIQDNTKIPSFVIDIEKPPKVKKNVPPEKTDSQDSCTALIVIKSVEEANKKKIK